LASGYPQAMAITRCVTKSTNSWSILPDCRSSSKARARADVRCSR
jgi:hypothetical protein